jgi:hypothetical protein
MGEVLELPKGIKTVKKAIRNKDFPVAIADPILRAAFVTL